MSAILHVYRGIPALCIYHGNSLLHVFACIYVYVYVSSCILRIVQIMESKDEVIAKKFNILRNCNIKSAATE